MGRDGAVGQNCAAIGGPPGSSRCPRLRLTAESNLLWVAALAAFVLVEKIAPRGVWVARGAGVLLVGWGAWLSAGAVG